MAEKAYYTTKELAERINMSVSYVKKWRKKIVGVHREGRKWLFCVEQAESRIARGLSVIKI